MSKSFGRKMRRARVEQGLSQTAVATKVGVSQAMISNWETGKGEPEQGVLKKLRRLLGAFDQQSNNSDRSDDYAASSSVFGDWLRKSRLASELSVPELSSLSGLSAVAIYNLEAGRSQNPQAETKKRLEDALKNSIPDDVQATVSEEQEIEGLGELTDFDPHDVQKLPSCSGVYMFYDISDRPVYVGQAKKISDRVKNHHDKFWFKVPIVNNGSYIRIDDTALRAQVEQVLIKFLKSNAVINKQGVDRS